MSLTMGLIILVPFLLSSECMLLQISSRDFLCQPYMVCGKEESITVPDHGAAVDRIDDGFPVPAADSPRCVYVRGQMHIQPTLRNHSLRIDRRYVLFSGAVPESVRRCHLLQFNIDRNRMALIGPDQRMIFIEGITLFFICPDDLFQ